MRLNYLQSVRWYLKVAQRSNSKFRFHDVKGMAMLPRPLIASKTESV